MGRKTKGRKKKRAPRVTPGKVFFPYPHHPTFFQVSPDGKWEWSYLVAAMSKADLVDALKKRKYKYDEDHFSEISKETALELIREEGCGIVSTDAMRLGAKRVATKKREDYKPRA